MTTNQNEYTPDRNLDPNQPRPAESPRRPGHKAAEPKETPSRPGDDERSAGLQEGGASPTAPAKDVNPAAQRAGEDEVRRQTDV